MIELIVNLVVLSLSILLYFRVADKYNIIDKPNQRSSHSSITIRGGGVIFSLSIILFSLWQWYINQPVDGFLLTGIVLVSVVSFIDDILTIKPLPRFLAHLTSVLLLLQSIGLYGEWSWYVLALVIVCTIGWINTFNFMDGINGITVLYALSILVPIYLYQLHNEGNTYLPEHFFTSVIAGLLVFGFFNVRKKAKSFAGDVGSVSMALIIAYVLLLYMANDWGWSAVVMVSIYGIDSVGTILQRLKRKENIFEAHRTHLYQYMANECKIPHVRVSLIYGLLQLAINAGWLYTESSARVTYTIVVLLLLAILYFPIKKKVLVEAGVQLSS